MSDDTEAREALAARYPMLRYQEHLLHGELTDDERRAVDAIKIALNRASEARAQALEMAKCAGFALDRISELDWSQDRDNFARDWHGHVDPALKRLDDLVEPLRALSLPDRIEG